MKDSTINFIHKHLKQYQSGWSLNNALYTTPESKEFDFALFHNHWFYVASICDIPDKGDYIVIEVVGESIIIVRDHEGEIKGFHNVCCHRGSQVILDKKGSCTNIVCHYHQWTYNLEGKLIFAGSMGKNFDPNQFALKPVFVEEVYGLIFVHMGQQRDNSIDTVKALAKPYLQRYNLKDLKVVHVDETIREANWKLVVENNRECYHCSCNHPALVNSIFAQGFGYDLQNPENTQLREIFAVKEKEWDKLSVEHKEQSFPDDLWIRLVRLPLANDAASQTIDGTPACHKLIAGFDYPESSELSVWTQSNSWHHFLNDCVVTFSVLPIDENRTMVRTAWLVHKDAIEGQDYHLEHLTHVWKITNEEDARLFESVMVGMQSSAFKPGPLAVEEKYVSSFLDWYVKESHKLIQQNSHITSTSISATKYSTNDLKPWTGDTGPIECINITQVTHNVKSFTFKSVNPAYFDFLPGQHITLVLPIDGQEIFRTYTIASSPTTPSYIKITNKLMPDGVVTHWMHNTLKVGDQIDAINIGGSFSPNLDSTSRKILLMSGGSGITPMLSISRYIYDHKLDWDMVFMHSAQSQKDLIEFDEMQTIENSIDAMKTLWVVDNGDVDDDWHGISGFVSKNMLIKHIPDFLEREIYCCGPIAYMDNVQNILTEAGFTMSHFHTESFDFEKSSANSTKINHDSSPSTHSESTIDIHETDTHSEFAVTLKKSEKMITVSGDHFLLSEIKKAGVPVPFACTQGVCGTCRTLKLRGEVDMKHQGGILKKHEEQGYILVCCSKAKSDLVLDI